MTDQKSWLWRKKTPEKTIIVAEKVDVASREREEEMHVLLAEKVDLERDLKDLDDKLSSALAECNVKDDLAKKHAKTAKEALAGWEKAEAKVLSSKQELDEALRQRDTTEDRMHHMDAALKECMQQLRFVREDQEQRIHDVLLKAAEELEETKMFLQEKLEESCQKNAQLAAENSQLGQILLSEKQIIEDLNQQMVKAEADVNALLAKLEQMEKDNNSLIYEVRLLEKEVDIRNEEREFNRRSADAAHKQHLENVKKIAKLESECQRLRVLVKKRLPGPAAVAKMKSEVSMLQREATDNRRKKSHSNVSGLQLDYAVDSYPESPVEKINDLTERICALEDENHSLREALQKKMNELQVSRKMYVQKSSKLSQLEAQLEELPKDQMIRDIRARRMSHDLSLASMSDVGSDDKGSCAGSWASASMSEMEGFRHGKGKLVSPSKSVALSEFSNFMDDFAEMEKLALVCVDKPLDYSPDSKSEINNALSESTGKELVLLTSVDETSAIADNTSSLPSNLGKSISKLIEIVEGIKLPSEDYDALKAPSARSDNSSGATNLETSAGYLVKVFQWRASEVAVVQQNFLRTCEDLLNGKTDYEIFTQELTSVLEWIMNHCFSLQDVSSMKDAVKKQFGWDETRSESESEVVFSQFSEAGKQSYLKEQLVSSALVTANGNLSQTHCKMNRDGRDLKDELEVMDIVKHESEIHSAVQESKTLRTQLQSSESIITSLQADLEAMKQSKAMMEDQSENNKITIEDLSSQLSAVKYELEEAHQNFASLQGELKNKMNHCEALEAECNDLKIHLERAKKVDTDQQVTEDAKQLRTEKEISAASEKLIQCQETILLLGKQLRALESSRNVVVSDKFISTPPNTNTGFTAHATATATNEMKLTSQRSSLLDQMQAEDNAKSDHLESPETKEIISAGDFGSQPSKDKFSRNNSKKNHNDIAVGPLAIVTSKKQHTTSGGLLKKLLWRRRKSNSKKLQLPFAA